MGQGLNGRVYLVRHKRLKVLRAMKIISYKDGNPDEISKFKREVLILKGLRYKGIPIIYDLEETEDGLYIIEEYFKGETLYSRVERVGVMSRAEILDLGIKLCDPIIYLHNQEHPILHLDIHPGNLIIQKDTVNLIDFDHAVWQDNLKDYSNAYGNIGYAAPEKYIDGSVDVRTDVYSIGAVLYYAGTGKYPDITKNFMPDSWFDELKDIINTCLHRDINERYKDVESLKKALESICLSEKNIPSHRIAIVSSARGAGATFISMSLAKFLKSKGIACIYEEKNLGGHMKRLSDFIGLKSDSYGYFTYDAINIRPYYTDFMSRLKHSATVYIEDYSSDIHKAIAERADMIILICAYDVWHVLELIEKYEDIIRDARRNNLSIIFNYCSNKDKCIEKIIDFPHYKLPPIAYVKAQKEHMEDMFFEILKEDINICREYKGNFLRRLIDKRNLSE